MFIYIKKHYTFFLLVILLWVTIPSIASDFKNPYNAPYDGERFQNLAVCGLGERNRKTQIICQYLIREEVE